jgi:hypothetical protein
MSIDLIICCERLSSARLGTIRNRKSFLFDEFCSLKIFSFSFLHSYSRQSERTLGRPAGGGAILPSIAAPPERPPQWIIKATA